MGGWDWLTKPAYTWGFVRRVAYKTLVLLIVVNVVYIVLNPLPYLSRLTLYNHLFSGRERLPFSELYPNDYSVPLHRLEGLMASHRISYDPKSPQEWRVVVLGDSGVWGWRQRPDETMTACLTDAQLQVPDGRFIYAYNLAYPYPSALKDALIMQQALTYEPDVVVWFITLKSLYVKEQTWHPLVQNNRNLAQRFVQAYAVDVDLTPLIHDTPTLLGAFFELMRDRSILGQRRELADLLRHQVYGPTWTFTRFDYIDWRFFHPPMNDLPLNAAIPSYETIPINSDLSAWLAWDVIRGAVEMAHARGVGVLIVNEPIYRATGANSDLHYNELYPRWAYDQYRQHASAQAEQHRWDYVDLWDSLPNTSFVEHPIHYTIEAGCDLMQALVPAMINAERSALIIDADSQ